MALGAVRYDAVNLSDPLSILTYAKELEGCTFRDVLDLGIAPEGTERNYGDKRYKGGMGTLVEERYFGYKANSDGRPDFPEAGVELKTTCYDVKKNGLPSAGERLVLTMIPLDRPVEDDIYESHMWEKAGKILLIYYRRDKGVSSYDQEISHVALFTPPESDMAIIEEDYNVIRDLVQAGKAEELSEGLTHYLGACTKGATEATMWTEQFYPPHSLAKKRAYCFKRSYMDYVLNHYLIGDEGDSERIIKDVPVVEDAGFEEHESPFVQPCISGLGGELHREPGIARVGEQPRQSAVAYRLVENTDDSNRIIKDSSVVKSVGFEEYVLSLVRPHVGKTDVELCQELGIEHTGNKSQWTTITYHLLGLRSDKAEEFEKANISARTVRIEENGSVRECLSLTPFTFVDLAGEEEWEDSDLCSYFEETRFFFVAFRKRGGDLVLEGARFWSMPKEDREGPLKDCWSAAVDRVRSGVTFTKQTRSDGSFWRVLNDLPAKTDNRIAHVRPHTSRSAYSLDDGTRIGDIEKDGDRLPDGQWMTKQSFWLNNDYIAQIVSEI